MDIINAWKNPEHFESLIKNIWLRYGLGVNYNSRMKNKREHVIRSLYHNRQLSIEELYEEWDGYQPDEINDEPLKIKWCICSKKCNSVTYLQNKHNGLKRFGKDDMEDLIDAYIEDEEDDDFIDSEDDNDFTDDDNDFIDLSN